MKKIDAVPAKDYKTLETAYSLLEKQHDALLKWNQHANVVTLTRTATTIPVIAQIGLEHGIPIEQAKKAIVGRIANELLQANLISFETLDPEGYPPTYMLRGHVVVINKNDADTTSIKI